MLEVGAASIVITQDVGKVIQAAGPNRVARYVRDECEANAVLIESESTSVLLISLDLAGLEMEHAWRVRRAAARGSGVNADNVLVAGTHTHSGPSILKTHPEKEVDLDYIRRLESWIEELSRTARVSARPARVAWGAGLAQIGYNRRCCWADGTHTMHGDCSRADFRGLEGPDDPEHIAFFAVDLEDKPIAVVYNNTTHTTTFYGADFFSADFPGLARKYLREALGEAVAVLYFNGAQGDISLEDQLTKHYLARDRETTMRKIAHQITGETLRLFAAVPFRKTIDLSVTASVLELTIRPPEPARISWADSILEGSAPGEDLSGMDRIIAFGIRGLVDEYGDSESQTVPMQVIRIGDLAFCAIPFELYCQFGLDIKRRSPAPVTGIVGIANGCESYIPTPYAAIGGGYSGEPIKWTRFETNAGFRIVDRTVDMLFELWPIPGRSSGRPKSTWTVK